MVSTGMRVHLLHALLLPLGARGCSLPTCATVSDVDGLLEKVADATVSRIMVSGGTYSLNPDPLAPSPPPVTWPACSGAWLSHLIVDRALELRAVEGEEVWLDGGDAKRILTLCLCRAHAVHSFPTCSTPCPFAQTVRCSI